MVEKSSNAPGLNKFEDSKTERKLILENKNLPSLRDKLNSIVHNPRNRFHSKNEINQMQKMYSTVVKNKAIKPSKIRNPERQEDARARAFSINDSEIQNVEDSAGLYQMLNHPSQGSLLTNNSLMNRSDVKPSLPLPQPIRHKRNVTMLPLISN